MTFRIEAKKFWSFCIWAGAFVYLTLAFSGVITMPSNYAITLISLFVFFFVNIYPRDMEHNNVVFGGMTHVHLLYASISAFGLAWVYYLISPEVAAKSINQNVISIIFNSQQYGRALCLSMMAFLCYSLAVQIGSRRRGIKETDSRPSKLLINEEGAANLIGWIGVVFISLMFLYVGGLMLTGGLRLSMSYTSFMELVSGSSIYQNLLFIYSAGICYVIACGNKAQLKIGVTLFGLVAIVLFMTGNRGEVLYAALACLGVLRRKGYKFNVKIVLGICVLVFIVIPFIARTRLEGVAAGFSSIGLDFTGTIVGMGGQLRCTTRVMDQFASGARQLIYGYSYYDPIINIFDHLVPFSIRLKDPASYDFITAFRSWGFNQIAEGYANFGAIGSCAYFFITGLFLSRKESKEMSAVQLAYYGSICATLINVSRNRFAFFWGHVLILTAVYIVVRYIGNHAKKE